MQVPLPRITKGKGKKKHKTGPALRFHDLEVFTVLCDKLGLFGPSMTKKKNGPTLMSLEL